MRTRVHAKPGMNTCPEPTLRARPEINTLIRSKISKPYQDVKVIEFDHLSPDRPLAAVCGGAGTLLCAGGQFANPGQQGHWICRKPPVKTLFTTLEFCAP